MRQVTARNIARVGCALVTFGLMVAVGLGANAGESVSAQEAAVLLTQIRGKCGPYQSIGEGYWRGAYKSPADAPGLVLLNKEIQRSVRGAASASEAREIAWQKCLDYVFNNQNSKGYLK